MSPKLAKPYIGARPGTPLTDRETEILRMLCQGYMTKHIAEMTGLSSSTVETHRAKLMVRTRSGTAVQLGVWAATNGYHGRQV